jgi:hypothetical protein
MLTKPVAAHADRHYSDWFPNTKWEHGQSVWTYPRLWSLEKERTMTCEVSSESTLRVRRTFSVEFKWETTEMI